LLGYEKLRATGGQATAIAIAHPVARWYRSNRKPSCRPCWSRAGVRRAVSSAEALTERPELQFANAMTVPTTKVFLDYSQEALDRAYEQRNWASNAEALIALGPLKSAETRRRFQFSTHRYGATPDESLDVFAARSRNAPLAIYIHGGSWRFGTREDVSFVAEALVPAGTHCIVLNFSNIPVARMPDMVEQIRRGIIWTYENAHRLGGDPERLHVFGHSSGGHLTSVMLTTDWTRYGLPARLFRSGLVVSGMYDLEAPMLSWRGQYAMLTREEEDSLSAMRHLDLVRCPIAVGYGDRESPEFQRQGRDFAFALRQAGIAHALQVGYGLNHFEVLHSITEPDGFFRRLALEMVAQRT
jgi:arylformamidase